MRFDLARTAMIAALVLIMAGACTQDVPVAEPVQTAEPAEPAEPAELQTGYWQAQITLPGGDINTAIEIGRSGANFRATLINGQERVSIDEVSFSDGHLLLRFPAFNSEINAGLENGNLVGTLTLVKRYGKTQIMPFFATPGAERSNTGTRDATTVDMSGRWAVKFQNEDFTADPSIGEFAQRGPRLFGTFLNPIGDYRYLSGYVRGNEFHLGTFDGAHAFIFAGRVENDVIIGADFWSGTEFHQTWSAVRDPDAILPDPYKLTYLNPDFDRFDFEFPDLDGRLISLADERFKGKVVVVTISGTWCPNCHDETRLLAPLYEEYHDQGLEVVALMYEHFEDHDFAIAQIRKFREKFDIRFETLVAGISDTTEVSKTLPSLNAVFAFPTTIYVDRSGMVRVIHTGFSGPGTGQHYERQKEEITSLIVELIEESVDHQESSASDGQDT